MKSKNVFLIFALAASVLTLAADNGRTGPDRPGEDDVSEPAVVKISEHLYLVSRKGPDGPDVAHCDVFAIDCGSEAVLIDAGPGDPFYEPMKSSLKALGLWDKLRTCLITHLHEDHAAGVHLLRKDGVRILAGTGAAKYSRNPALLKAHFRGEAPVIDEIVKDRSKLKIGDVTFQAVYTPGHTAGCVTWAADIDGLKCAFTGDLLFPGGTIGWAGSFDFDAAKLKASLKRLLAMDIDAVFTGHQWQPKGPGDFWLKDAKKHIAETLKAGEEGRWKLAH